MTRLVVLALCAAALAAGCGGGSAPHHRSLPELTGISQLQTAFDAHPGVPRLLILLSPT